MSEQIRTDSSSQTPRQPPAGGTAAGPELPEPATTNRKFAAIFIAIAVAAIILIVLAIWFLTADPQRTANIRDIFIIAMAFVSGAIGVLMFVLIWQLQSLIVLLRNEIKPILTNANQTVNTVRGTTVFVSDNLVKPTIGLASFVAGVKGVQQAFVARVNSMGKRSGAARKP